MNVMGRCDRTHIEELTDRCDAQAGLAPQGSSELDTGASRGSGHFAPFEEPELYAQELRAFFLPYRGADTA
jgi:pimeloyl-ACP methyl ester carboxylesterase